MTVSERPVVVQTSDRGLIQFPRHCAPWCDERQHFLFASESDNATAAEVVGCYRSGGQSWLHQLSDSRTGRVHRNDRGSYELVVKQTLAEPGKWNSGWAGPPLVELAVGQWVGDKREFAALNLTTGEVRTLIFRLQKLVDIVDGGER